MNSEISFSYSDTCPHCGSSMHEEVREYGWHRQLFFCGMTREKRDDWQELTPCPTEEGEDEEGNCGTCGGENGRHLSICRWSNKS